MLGMNLARFYQFPEVKEKGLHGLPRLVAFVSEHSHYSARKNGSLLGIGSDNVVAVECDEQGKMKPERLDYRINEVKKQVQAVLSFDAEVMPFLMRCTCVISHL